MAKGWPTISKGVFYTGFNKAKSESKSAGDRDNSKVKSPATNRKITDKGRMVYPAKSPLSDTKMRKPL